ncbi:MAG: right-handed parallel beta-helix repeat-containing protein [Opitutales bacterium]
MIGILAFIVFSSGGRFAAAEAPGQQREGEVVRDNDTWNAQVNGETLYHGADMIQALQAAANGLTPERTSKETVNVRSSGSTGSHSGNGGVKAVDISSYTLFDFHGNTMNVNDDRNNLIVPFRGQGVDDIEIRNLKITGNPRYGIWLLGCINVTLSDVHLSISETKDSRGPGIGIRIEARNGQTRGRWNENVELSGVVVEGSKGHGVEFWGTDGIRIDTITTRNTGGSGLLINNNRNVRIGIVDAYRANHGGGYAGFRTANGAGPNITVDKVIARECGRGIFTVSGSHGITIHEVDIIGSTGQGILIEDSQDIQINGGAIHDCGSEGIRIASRRLGQGPGSDHHPSKNVTIQNVRISGCPYGIRETLPRTNSNVILNNDLRGNGACLVHEGEGTVAEGNICSAEQS